MGGLDLAAFRRAVDDAVDFDDYLDSPWDHARGIQNVVRAITELLEEGFAAEVVELSEYALAKIEGIRDYAVDGTIYSILEDLHHEACKRAKPAMRRRWISSGRGSPKSLATTATRN